MGPRTSPGRRKRKSPKPRSPRGAPGRDAPLARTARIQKIVQVLARCYHEPGLALTFSTPLELLVALILAAQCTDERVNRVTASLFTKYKTPLDWATADRDTLESEIRTTGFYRNKAKSIQACCRELVDRFGNQVPQQLEALVSLPGVGRKTANILRGNAFNQPAIGVDTHVARLAQRLGLTTHTDPDKIEFDLILVVPDSIKVRFCRILQAHGRTVCVARKPNCEGCAINHLCPYPRQAGIKITSKR